MTLLNTSLVQSQQPERDSTITKAFDTLDRAVDNLSMTLNELEDRISPVMLPAVPAPSKPQAVDAATCPLHGRIMKADDDVAALTVRLRALLDRLQL